MAKKIKPRRSRYATLRGKQKKDKDLEQIQANLEKTGEALGDLFKGIFKGVGRVLEVAKDMEEKSEEVRTYKKEIKGVTKSGKEYRGEAGWKIGFLESIFKKRDRENK